MDQLAASAELAGFRLGGDMAGNYTLICPNGAEIGTGLPRTDRGATLLLCSLRSMSTAHWRDIQAALSA